MKALLFRPSDRTTPARSRIHAFVLTFALGVSGNLWVTDTASACTQPRPPKVWRVFTPGDPANGTPHMIWVGVESGLFFGTGGSRCGCGIGVSGLPTGTLGKPVAVRFTITNRKHRPIVVGPGPLGIPLGAFNLQRDAELDERMAQIGSLGQAATWAGFQSPPNDPVIFSQLIGQLLELGAIDREKLTVLNPWRVKIWFKFNLPFPQPVIPPVKVQYITGATDDPAHPLVPSEISEPTDVFVDPNNDNALLVNVQGNLLVRDAEPPGDSNVELEPTLVQVPLRQLQLDGAPGFANEFRLPELTPRIPRHWWLKIFRPVFRLAAMRTCLNNPGLGDCNGIIPEDVGPLARNGFSVSENEELLLADDVEGQPVPETERPHGTVNTNVEFGADNIVDLSFQARLHSNEANDVIPEDGALSRFKVMPDNFVIKPFNPWRRLFWGKDWVIKIFVDSSGALKIVHVVKHWHTVLHWKLPLLVDPRELPPFPFEVEIKTAYTLGDDSIVVRDDVRLNPIVLNANPAVCLADTDRNGSVGFADLGVISNAFGAADRRCRVNNSIIPQELGLPDIMVY